MKGKVWIASFVAALLACTVSQAQDRSLGLRLGYPLGITYKAYVQSNHAVEFLLEFVGIDGSGLERRVFIQRQHQRGQ